MKYFLVDWRDNEIDEFDTLEEAREVIRETNEKVEADRAEAVAKGRPAYTIGSFVYTLIRGEFVEGAPVT